MAGAPTNITFRNNPECQGLRVPSKEDCYLAVFMTENSSQEIGCHNKGIGDGQRSAASRPIFRLFSTVFWFSIGDILRVIFVRILLR